MFVGFSKCLSSRKFQGEVASQTCTAQKSPSLVAGIEEELILSHVRGWWSNIFMTCQLWAIEGLTPHESG